MKKLIVYIEYDPDVHSQLGLRSALRMDLSERKIKDSLEWRFFESLDEAMEWEDLEKEPFSTDDVRHALELVGRLRRKIGEIAQAAQEHEPEVPHRYG